MRQLLTITEATISDNVATRRPRLAEAALELAAECLLRFHRTINGSLASALKSRPGSHARRLAVGARPLEVSDLAELVTVQGPHRAAARASVRELLTPILDRLEAEAPGPVVL